MTDFVEYVSRKTVLIANPVGSGTAHQASIVVNAEVDPNIMVRRNAKNANSAAGPHVFSGKTEAPGLLNVNVHDLMFASATDTTGLMWASFNGIDMNMDKPVFMGVADTPHNVAERNRSLTAKISVCVHGTRTILNTGANTIHTGDDVYWDLPLYVGAKGDPKPGVQVRNTCPERFTASVWPSSRGYLNIHRHIKEFAALAGFDEVLAEAVALQAKDKSLVNKMKIAALKVDAICRVLVSRAFEDDGVWRDDVDKNLVKCIGTTALNDPAVGDDPDDRARALRVSIGEIIEHATEYLSKCRIGRCINGAPPGKPIDVLINVNAM